MKESSVYQMIIERSIEIWRAEGFEKAFEYSVEQGKQIGIERGKQLAAKAHVIECILALLNRRFNISIASILTPSLEAIDDFQQLNQLMDKAGEVEHLENFMQVLETYRNGT